ncbi:dihydrofolate reductase family protein [Microbacterium sp. NPDC090218]
MQTLTIDFISSLDGYGAAEGWPGWWGLESPEYLAWMQALPDKDAPVLMGATTYRVMSELTAAGEPGTDVLDGMHKYVFSSSLEAPLAWQNATLVSTDAIEYVRRLKEESDRPLRTIGSVALCRSLLVAGLVDRYRVVIFPVITGATGQERIYDGYPDVALDLVEARTFDQRTQLLEYIPTVLDGPPGR